MLMLKLDYEMSFRSHSVAAKLVDVFSLWN